LSQPAKALAAAREFEKVLELRSGEPEATCGAGWAYARDQASGERAAVYLRKCREVAKSPQERRRIDAKLQALAAGSKSEPPEEAPDENSDEPAR
jgi:hypothetical protein